MDKVMDFDHGEWTDKLSDYLDDELPDAERRAIESHLAGCTHCAAVLADLKRVIARAQGLEPRPPQADLWGAVTAHIEQHSARRIVAFEPRRRISFTFTEALAASLLIALVSGALAWTFAGRIEGIRSEGPASAVAPHTTAPAAPINPIDPIDPIDNVQMATVSVADPQYDAAVADLEKAVKQGRGRLDGNTIAIVEHNLQIIDQAIEQARQALAADPANSYLSSHLFEARRRKLDLLRRAAALSSESD